MMMMMMMVMMILSTVPICIIVYVNIKNTYKIKYIRLCYVYDG